MVNIVAGSFDIVAVIEGSDPGSIGTFVMKELHALDGIKSTLTLITIA